MNEIPITVLHIASGDLWAGAEVQLFTLANALKKNTNTVVHIILLNHGRLEKELIDCGFEVSVFDETKYNGFQILRKLINVIKKVQPDVIHSHRSKENILGSIASLLSGRIPTMRTTHGAPEQKTSWLHISKQVLLFLDWFIGRFLQKKIIAVTDDLAGILQKSFPASKIKVIQNGINTESIIASVETKAENNSPFRIGIAGRLVAVKRVDIFIKSAKELMNTHPKLHISFHIFGDGPLLNDLIKLNTKLQTTQIVNFEGHCDNMPQKLQQLDAIVMTSDHEGLPMILLEAMALQVPVIAHAVGGIPNLLKQGKCGSLVKEHNSLGYSTAIAQVVQESKYRKTIKTNALHHIKAHYSAEKNAEAYYTQYKKLL
jgi:glycosyltransferase involved in cell wall biosynthesis